MVDQVAGITLKADASQPKAAADTLDRLADSAQKAETAAEGLDRQATRMGKSFGEASRAAKEQSDAITKVVAGTTQLSEASGNVADAVQREVDALQKSISVTSASISASRQRTAELQAQRNVLQSQAAVEGQHTEEIKQKVAALNQDIALERKRTVELQAVQKAERGALESTKANLEALKQTPAAYNKSAEMAEKLGMSQKNLAFATRNTVFQLQDVAVSLDMGMPAYRVILQQVPQITGAFGGLANTLKYVVAMVGPVGLAIGAIGVALGTWATIATRNERTLSSLNKTLVLTGDYSGLTADAIIRMGESAKAAGRSFSDTVDAVQALAQAGVSAGANFEQLAKAAQDFAKASGQPIDDVVGQLAKISDDPVGGLKALQQQYHNVTDAQIAHIQKMVEQGEKARAVSEGNAIAANSFDEMSSKIRANMGTLEKAMDSVTKMAKGMWDAILDVGRPTTEQGQIQGAQDTISRLQSQLKGITDNIAQNNGISTQQQREAIARLKDQINEQMKLVGPLKATAAAMQLNNDITAASAAAQQEKNEKDKVALAFLEKYATNGDRRAKAEKEAQALLKNGIITQEQYAKALKQIDEMYKDPAVKKAAAVKVDAGLRMVEAAKKELETLKAIKEARTGTDAMGAEERKATEKLYEMQAAAQVLAEASKTRLLTTAEKQQQVEQANAIAIQKAVVAEAKRVDLLDKAAKTGQTLKVYQDQISDQATATAATYAMSTREARETVAWLKEADRLRRSGVSEEDIRATEKMWKELQRTLAGDNATLWDGFQRGAEDSIDALGNGYTQAQELTKTAFSTMSDTLTDFFETGKFGMKDMINIMLKELIRLSTSSALKSLASLFGVKGSGGGSFFGDIFGALTKSANGNVMSGGNLSQYSGMIVDTPTLFNFGQLHKFANGAGLMGEAGPEAIMPLKRGADGKLGVQATGGGGAPSVVVNVSIADGQAKTDVKGSSDLGQAVGAQLGNLVRNEVLKMTKPGGLLART